MKLFKRKDKLEENIKSQATATMAFMEKLEMLNRIEREGDWFRRWRILYNELRPIDIILLIAIKLFFEDAPGRKKGQC